MDTNDRAYLWCTTCEKEGSEITCPDCNKPMLIVPSKSVLEKMGTGLYAQLNKGPVCGDFSLSKFRHALLEFYEDNEYKEEEHRPLSEFELKCLDMTDEELEEFVPHGSYEIGTGSFVGYTGKGGFIMYIKALRDKLKS